MENNNHIMNIDIKGAIVLICLSILWYYLWKKSGEKYFKLLMNIVLVLAIFNITDYLIMHVFHSPQILRYLSASSYRVIYPIAFILMIIGYYSYLKRKSWIGKLRYEY